MDDSKNSKVKMLQINEHEILFLYNSNLYRDKKALGYAKSLKHLQIKEFDLTNNLLTETQIEELAERLNVDPIEIVDHEKKLYREKYANKDLDRNDILKILRHNPDLIRTPIAVYHDKARFVETGYEFVKEDMVNTGKKRSVTNKER